MQQQRLCPSSPPPAVQAQGWSNPGVQKGQLPRAFSGELDALEIPGRALALDPIVLGPNLEPLALCYVILGNMSDLSES